MAAIRTTRLLDIPGNLQNSFQTLRTNIQFAGIDKEIKTIAVTSALPSEGKTTICVLLAKTMADAGKRTLIVDVDCRRPMVANLLGIRPKSTWLDVLVKGIPCAQAVSETQYNNLYLLDTEPQIPHTVELLGSSRFAALISELRGAFDVVLFDTPPVNRFIDAAVLVARMDGTLLVINANSSTIEEEREALAQLQKANTLILGAVFNGVKSSKKDEYYYYYYRDRDGKRSKRKRQTSR